MLANLTRYQKRIGAYIVVGDHLPLGNDLLVPFTEVVLLGDIDTNERSALNLPSVNNSVLPRYTAPGCLTFFFCCWGFLAAFWGAPSFLLFLVSEILRSFILPSAAVASAMLEELGGSEGEGSLR